VNSILDLSQIKNNSLKIVKQSFVLDDIMEEVKSLYLYQCQVKNIKLIIEKASNVPKELFTDRYRLMEILVNLMGNAVKFTFKGSVTLKIELDSQRRDKLKFSIIDTGIGIKEEDQAQLFQRYHKIQNEDENININGVGLGLTIVKELVAALNSNDQEEDHIELRSEYMKGSTFIFKIDNGIMIPKPNQQLDLKKDIDSMNMSSIIQEYREDDDVLSNRVKNYGNLCMTTFPFSSDYLLSPDRLKTSLFESPKKTERAFFIKE